jgi:hypothetical protein
MSAIEDQDLAAYVLGDAPQALCTRVDAAAAADEDFAAELAALAALGAVAEPGQRLLPPSVPPTRPRHRRLWRRAAVAATVAFSVGGVAWGGYELLRTPPLLEDDFRSRTISHGTWNPYLGRKGVSAHDGYLRLLNRGSVVSRREFEEPVEVTFDWRWVDHAQWPLYSEVLQVALRTHGQHAATGDYRIVDGLLVGFDAVEHCVKISVGDAVEGPLMIGRTPRDSAPLPAGEWHRVRIVDAGGSVSVYLKGPSVDPRFKTEPLLTVAVPPELTGRQIAFFNREYVAGTNHESHIDNVRVRAVK